MDDAVIEVQTRLAFQEDTIEALNQALADQQRQIDQLRLQVEHLREKLEGLEGSLPTAASGDQERPPHY